MQHNREPVGDTCPTIDGIIANLKSAISIIEDIESETGQDAIDEIENAISDIESVRSDNSDLRAWGVSEAEAIDKIYDIAYGIT